MYPNYPCRQARSCCNDVVDMDPCCNIGRRNQSMVECCSPPRCRLQDFRVFESKPRSTRCKSRLAHSLSEAQQQTEMLKAAAAIAAQNKLIASMCCPVIQTCPQNKNNSRPAPQSPYSSASSSKLSSPSSSQDSSAARSALQAQAKKQKKRPKDSKSDKDMKAKGNQSCYSVCITEVVCDPKHNSAETQQKVNPKYLKNKQNYQYQDDTGKKKHMEVINEEQEEMCSDDSNSILGGEKKIQESCADFLSIVHDTVLETVQRSVECILKDYFIHTVEKIECLCSQMVRNDCLMSKMYLDIMDKISQQNEKGQRQFKCLCQFLIDTRKSTDSQTASTSELDCHSQCPNKNANRCACGCKREGSYSEESKHSSNLAEDDKSLRGTINSIYAEVLKNNRASINTDPNKSNRNSLNPNNIPSNNSQSSNARSSSPRTTNLLPSQPHAMNLHSNSLNPINSRSSNQQSNPHSLRSNQSFTREAPSSPGSKKTASPHDVKNQEFERDRERESMKHERDSTKHERDSTKHERDSTKHERDSTKHERENTRPERVSKTKGYPTDYNGPDQSLPEQIRSVQNLTESNSRQIGGGNDLRNFAADQHSTMIDDVPKAGNHYGLVSSMHQYVYQTDPRQSDARKSVSPIIERRETSGRDLSSTETLDTESHAEENRAVGNGRSSVERRRPNIPNIPNSQQAKQSLPASESHKTFINMKVGPSIPDVTLSSNLPRRRPSQAKN